VDLHLHRVHFLVVTHFSYQFSYSRSQMDRFCVFTLDEMTAFFRTSEKRKRCWDDSRQKNVPVPILLVKIHAAPFNIAVIQVYVQTAAADDDSDRARRMRKHFSRSDCIT